MRRVFALRAVVRLPAGALVCAAAIGLANAQNQSTKLTIATWGGAYGQSQGQAFFEPFAKETGIRVEAVTYDGTLSTLRRKISENTSPWDVVDASPAAIAALCDEGLLERIDTSILVPTEGRSNAAEDFIEGALQRCGVGSVAWSAVVIFNRKSLAKRPPHKIADLLDLRAFPGKRALPKGPRYTLEFALMADGIAPDAVYRELGSDAGVDRAFAALDKIKSEILWWEKGQEPLAWLAEDKISMGIAFNGRVFSAVATDGDHVGILWDGQIYDFDQWAIPGNARHKAEARRFVAYATEPQRLAEQARWIAYGPARKSALPLVGRHAALEIEMAPHLPTTEQNLAGALHFDEGWWMEHGEALDKRFQDWLGPSGTKAASSATPQASKAEAKAGNGQPEAKETETEAGDRADQSSNAEEDSGKKQNEESEPQDND